MYWVHILKPEKKSDKKKIPHKAVINRLKR